MPPVLVDSTHCHLWTDALHVRQLALEAANRWDRGTYVRLTVVLTWTALEIACQDALGSPEIGYRFKENLDAAIAAEALAPLIGREVSGSAFASFKSGGRRTYTNSPA